MAYNVAALAAYTKTNERDLIAKALFQAKSISLATKMPDVKSTAQVNKMDTDAVFQVDSCGFNSSGTTTFTNRVITVGAIKVNEALCPKTLETKYLQLALPAGSNYESVPFEQQYTDLKAGIIAEHLETAFWQGDTGSGNANLNKFDGLIKLIDAASDEIEANVAIYMVGAPITAATGITASNAIAIFQGIYKAIPTSLLKKADLKVFCGVDVFRTYILALTNANLFHYTTDASAGTFEIMIPGTNLTIVAVDGLNGTNRIFALQTSNMFFGTDMMAEIGADGADVKFEMFFAKEANEVRYQAAFKAGSQVGITNEIVKFTLVP